MKKQDWLTNYQNNQGIKQSFGGLVRRAAYLTESDTAFTLFENNYAFLQECYKSFFPDLKKFVLDQKSYNRTYCKSYICTLKPVISMKKLIVPALL